MEKQEYTNIEDIINEKSGVEPENEIVDSDIEPYNPEKISIETKRISMETCLRRLKQGTFVLNPEFQRKEVWSNDKKSLLIESLMLKIPIPMFYVSSDERGTFTIVDGLQRLSAIRDYIVENKLVLQNLEFWKEFNGKKFDELPDYLQNRILETEFTFTVINPATPEEVKLNIFKRINTGGMPLSAQEIRNALYVGKSTRLLQKLSESSEFKNATCYSVRGFRMEDKELILRYLSFVLNDFKNYGNKSMDSQLCSTMLELNKMNDEQLLVLEQDFKKAMKRCYEIFEKHTFRKSLGNARRSSINKCLFEVWGNVMSKLADNQFDTLLTHKNDLITQYQEILFSQKFMDSISRDSWSAKSVLNRFSQINNLVNNFINV